MATWVDVLNNESDRRHENLETFSLVWLDAQANHDSVDRNEQNQLRAIINYLKIFENADDCQKFMEDVPKHHYIVFVVSGRLGREVVPRIHHLRQVTAIYVYCMDKGINEQWSQEFKKV
jgi:hypothetical protein